MATKKELSKEQRELYTELKKLQATANQRLARLEKATGRELSWAGYGLRDKLESKMVLAWNSNSNRISLNQSMTEMQMKASKKAIENFLKSKTSTVRGIKKVKSTTIKSLRKSLSIPRRSGNVR